VVFRIADITPIFSRIWLMKMRQVRDLETVGQFTQRLGHEPRLQAHVAVAHFAVKFGLGDECLNRIHN